METAFIFYFYDAMSNDAVFISIEHDVANLNHFRSDGLNRNHIFMQDGRIHTVAGSFKTHSVTIVQKIGNQIRKYLYIVNSASVRSAALDERFT